VTLFRAIADGLRSRRDVFNRQGIPGESLVGPSWAGLRIDQATASRMIAIHAAWSLIADSVGLIPWGAFEEVGDARVPLPEMDWMYQPVPDDPSITWDEHVSQLAVSLASDGSAFTMVLPEVLDPAELRVLDPERVLVKRVGAEPRYHYRPEGGGLEVLGPDQVIHISRLRRPGQLRGLSPIDEAAQSLSKVRAADRLGARVFDNAVLLSGYVSVPGALSKEGIDLLSDEIAKQYGGGQNAGKPGIFANGARWEVPAPNLEDMQLLELLRWGVLDVARLYHIPPHKLGDNSPGSVSYGSVEQQAIEWVTDGVRPYVTRIENAYRRLIPGRRTYVRANVDGLLRGDFKTRMEGIEKALQNRLLLLDEARALEERPPLSSIPTDRLYGPGGFLQTPNNTPPPPSPGRQTA
jgi:HK97 family phage portal protein